MTTLLLLRERIILTPTPWSYQNHGLSDMTFNCTAEVTRVLIIDHMTTTEYLRQAFRYHRTSQPIATPHYSRPLTVIIPLLTRMYYQQMIGPYVKNLETRYQNARTSLRISTSWLQCRCLNTTFELHTRRRSASSRAWFRLLLCSQENIVRVGRASIGRRKRYRGNIGSGFRAQPFVAVHLFDTCS